MGIWGQRDSPGICGQGDSSGGQGDSPGLQGQWDDGFRVQGLGMGTATGYRGSMGTGDSSGVQGQFQGIGSVLESGLAPYPGLSPTPHPGTVPLSPAPSPSPVLVAVTAPVGWGTGRGLLARSRGGSQQRGQAMPVLVLPVPHGSGPGVSPGWRCPGRQAQHCTVLPGRSGRGHPVGLVLGVLRAAGPPCLGTPSVRG